MPAKTYLSHSNVQDAVIALAERHTPRPVFGVPRGGCVPAALLAGLWRTPLLDRPEAGCLVVDDLVDSGATRDRYAAYTFDALYHKTATDGWLVFPWEIGEEVGPTDAVRRLLQYVGEDPDREGLRDTPRRFIASWDELTYGYELDPADVLGVQFVQEAIPYTGIVVLRAIPFASLCEHHILPFTGTADVAYVPGESGRIVGLSKLARLVDVYARRLQVQERMTVEIVEALVTHLEPMAAACIIRADHMCMSMRGVGKVAGGMVTSELRGAFYDDARARAELMQLLAP